MNTPQEQADLYRKAAETIEMCAKHGIEAKFKYYSNEAFLLSPGFDSPCKYYEFPLAVIEGQLVWADTVVYNKGGVAYRAGSVITNHWESYTLTPPKQPLCEVEGKPVYKGDKLYNRYGVEFYACKITSYGSGAVVAECESIGDLPKCCSWNPPKRTVMVELPMNTVESYAATNIQGCKNLQDLTSVVMACRKALDNLKR